MEAILVGVSIGIYFGGLIITGAIFYYGIETNELDSFEDVPVLYILGCIFWPPLWVSALFLGSIQWLGKKAVLAKEKQDALKEEVAE